jgi:hypothetical protein
MSGPLIARRKSVDEDKIYALFFDSSKKQRIDILSFKPTNQSGYSFSWRFYKSGDFQSNFADAFFSVRQSNLNNQFVLAGNNYPPNRFRMDVRGGIAGTLTTLLYSASTLTNINNVYRMFFNVSGTKYLRLFLNDSQVATINSTDQAINVQLNLNDQNACIGSDIFDLTNRNYNGYIAEPIFYKGDGATEILKPDFKNAYTSGANIIVPDLCNNYEMRAINWTNLADFQSALIDIESL